MSRHSDRGAGGLEVGGNQTDGLVAKLPWPCLAALMSGFRCGVAHKGDVFRPLNQGCSPRFQLVTGGPSDGSDDWCRPTQGVAHGDDA